MLTLWHFPYEERDALALAVKTPAYPGVCFVVEDGKRIVKEHRVALGKSERSVRVPEEGDLDCVVDLQTAADCYCADTFRVDGETFVFLRGSGWKNCGWPFDAGRYFLLGGKTARKFVDLASQDFIPGFREAYSGRIQDFAADATGIGKPNGVKL
jgi:hypothetical protein